MIRVDVDGTDQLADTMAGAADDLRDLRRPGDRAGDLLADDARRRAPRRTGRLRASIRAVAEPRGATVTAGGPGVRYAGVQEYGWRRRGIRPRHFMRDAAAAKADRVADVYGDRVGDILDDVKGA